MKQSAFATTVQDNRRVEIFQLIDRYQHKLPTTKRADVKRSLDKEITNLKKELSKLPQGMLTETGALSVRGPIDKSNLVDIWKEGAHETMLDEISPELAYYEYCQNNTDPPLTLEYFKQVFNFYR